MIRLKFYTAIAFTAMATLSCSTDTEGIGSSLTRSTDQLQMSTGTYQAYARSFLADSVYARNYDSYLGKVKDPETGAYVKTEFMAQFNMLEHYNMPTEEELMKDANGKVYADSCEIWLYFDKGESYGDSLAPIKMDIRELRTPMSDTNIYYSNFDPKAEGYIRTDGLHKRMVFSLRNLTYSDSIRQQTSYTDIARISLKDPYTDVNGLTYQNYGTYILRNFYEHREYFKNSYTFIHKICPGFYFEVSDGLGVMAKIARIEMRVAYHCKIDTTIYARQFISASTTEVLQTTKVTNDLKALSKLQADDNCTYIKSPAGIFTEVTLPVDDITQQHKTDSLLSVGITFLRQNSDFSGDEYAFKIPSNLLLIQKDSLDRFFEKKKMYDYKTSFLASLSKNAYEFTNIGNMITRMSIQKANGTADDPNWVEKHPDWNKAVLVPVSLTQSVTYDYYGNASYTTSGVNHEMGLTSTKLMGGPYTPIEVKVVFAKFNNQ